MTDRPQQPANPSHAKRTDRVDQHCDRFEQDWLAGGRPRIEDYLAQAAELDHSELFGELLAVELWHRRQRGESPSAAEYLGRFPDRAERIAMCFIAADSLGDTAGCFDPFSGRQSQAEPASRQTGGLSAHLGRETAMAVTLDDFQSRLIDSGLISSDDLRAVIEMQPADRRPSDAEQLARCLVKQEKLTAWQAQQIYAGRGKSLVMGNYVLLDKLGQGGMGMVLRAEHRRMKRQVALKTLSPKITESPELLARFQREVQAAARLEHPNIVTAYDADMAGDTHFLVMQYVAGDDLSQVVKQRGVLPVGQAVDYIQQAARGLEYAHGQGVVHRDVKPANLLLDRSGTVKVLDMGLARIESAEVTLDDLTGMGAIMGTIDYMAPEQAEDTHQADARADVYSLGCSLFYLLGGRPLYEGDTIVKKLFAHRDGPIPRLQSVANGVSDDLEAVFQKMVAKRPEERHQTMSEVVAELERCRTPADSSAPVLPARSGDSRLDAFLEQLETNSLPAPGTYRAAATPMVQAAPAVREHSATVNVTSADFDTNPQTQTYVPASPATRHRGGRGGRRGAPLWSLACGGLAACLLLGGIVIRITTKDGKTTEIEVPEGAKVEVVGKPMATGVTEDQVTTSVTPLDAPIDHSRVAAEAVLRMGGLVRVNITGLRQELSAAYISKLSDLPVEPFAIDEVHITHCKTEFLATRQILAPVHREFRKFTVTNCNFDDADLAYFRDLDCLTVNLRGTAISDMSAPIMRQWPRVRKLDLSSTSIGDETCRALAEWPVLGSLHVKGAPITDAGLAALAECANLSRLDLSGCRSITAEGLNALQKMPELRQLGLVGCGLGDEIVDGLAEASQLNSIALRDTDVTDEGARRLQQALPRAYIDHPATEFIPEEQEIVRWALEQNGKVENSSLNRLQSAEDVHARAARIYFGKASPPGDQAVRLTESRCLHTLTWWGLVQADDLVSHLAHATCISQVFFYQSDLTGLGLARMAPLTGIQQLVLTQSGSLDDAAFSRLPSLPHLYDLQLYGCPIEGPSLEYLQNSPNLQILDLSATPIVSESLRHLVPLKYLRNLYLRSTAVDDAAVPHLSECGGLKNLSLKGTKITAEGIEQLRAALPKCVIIWDGGLVRPNVPARDEASDPSSDSL